MAIEITARHLHVTDSFQAYALARVEKVIEQFPKIEHVRVVLDKQRHLYSAEIIVQKKGETLVGLTGQAENIRSAIDTASARVEKQLRNHKRKAAEARRVTAAA